MGADARSPNVAGPKFSNASDALPADVAAALQRVSDGKAAWQALGVDGRLEKLKELRKRAAKIDWQAWATTSVKVQGLNPDHGNARALILAETMIIAANIGGELTRLIESLTSIVKTGSPPKCSSTTSMPLGHTASHVFPRTLSDKWMNPMGMLGWSVEVWTEGEPTQGSAVEAAAATVGGAAALVLGAGNQEFLTVVDCLDQLFVRGRTVLLKHHPLRESQQPFVLAFFAPLVEFGAFASVCGDAAVGTSLAQHQLVDALHMTGGGGTHDT